ncbi:hypothetical protein D3C81_1077250 [compost metagenome]
MKAVADNELVLSSDLHVVPWLELTVSHMIFFHPHECGVRVGFAVAIALAENLKLLLVFL